MEDASRCRAYSVVRDLILDDETLGDISQRLLIDINKGLSKDGHANAVVKCYQTYVQDFPSGQETGRYLALDLGGTNFRVLMITLGGPERFKMEKRNYEFPNEIKTGSGEQLFDYVAKCAKDFLSYMKKQTRDVGMYPMGFTFSFPVRQKGLNKGILMKWTKGFNASGVIGKDVVQQLHAAFTRQNIDNVLSPVAILNDTTGTLMSCAWGQPDTRIGLIVGTGTNACYAEKIENIELFDGDRSKPYMIINTEWGNFGADGRLNDILSEFDRIVDGYTQHSGEQLYEKLISGRYLSEVMRLIILKMIGDRILFHGNHEEKFTQKFSLKSESISRMESDPDGKYEATEGVLREWGIDDYDEDDLSDLRFIAETLSTRSASLVSAGIATLLNKMQISPVTVAVDGSLYRYHPRYKQIMAEKIRYLTEPHIKLMLSEDGSGRGAALVAAVLASNGPARRVK